MSKHFHALGVGRVFTGGHHRAVQRVRLQVSMPSVSGGRLQSAGRGGTTASSSGFYALGVGRAFTAPAPDPGTWAKYEFLCPRWRAGVYSCTGTRTMPPSGSCFHALGVGRAFTGLIIFMPSELGGWGDLRAVG